LTSRLSSSQSTADSTSACFDCAGFARSTDLASSPFLCLSTSYRATLRECESCSVNVKRSSSARAVRPVFPASRGADPCCRPLSSAACAELNAPTDHPKCPSAPLGVFGSDRRTSSGIERHAAIQILAHCLRCLREDYARPPCTPRRGIEPIEHNPVIKCQHCEDTRQYLTKDCFLAPSSTAVSPDKSAGALDVVAA
jgi:hypothetical protein